MNSNKITFVTALYDLKRDSLQENFNRSMDQYLSAFKKLLDQDINLVVYCDKRVADFVNKHRDTKNTKVIVRNIQFPFKDLVENIRTKKEWYSQAGWLEQSPQAKLEYYNPLVMSKQFMLNDSSIHNYFSTKYFVWIDAGLANSVNINHFFNTPQFEYKLSQDLKNNKMLHVAFPYDGKYEVHGFKKTEMNRLAGTDTEYVCRGGIFGGTRDAINKVNEVYYHMLHNTLQSGYMGTEESVFTILSYKHPDYYNIEMINPNGLLGTYFDRVQNREERKDTDLALYFLTFNAPEQLQKCLESFKDTFPKEFNDSSKYVIDNSTDSSVQKSYDELYKNHGINVHRFDNIGITGGREFSAKHFAKSDHKYMIFFEDDMMINGPEEKGNICKAGFKKYDEDLIEKSIMILEENELDYLKLTFSEFFGTNHDNWSWHNMDSTSKEKYLKSDIPINKTVSYYTGCYNNLAYAVGEYFYCNWPILFSKEGNKKFFIDSDINPRSSESTLMAKMQIMIREKKIRAGCLLASPVTHKRFKHYSKGQRVENKFSA